MDDIISPSKFGDVTWPSSDFMGHSEFYRPAFLGIIVNLWDMDLKFSGFIFDVSMDNPEKIGDVSMPRKGISKNRDFWNFGL